MLQPIPAALDPVGARERLGQRARRLSRRRAASGRAARERGADRRATVCRAFRSTPCRRRSRSAPRASTSRATTPRRWRSPSGSARGPFETDFAKPPRTCPIVVDAGLTPPGLSYAIRATEPEGVCQSVSFYAGRAAAACRSAACTRSGSALHGPLPRGGAAARGRAPDRVRAPAARGRHHARRRLEGGGRGVPRAGDQARRATLGAGRRFKRSRAGKLPCARGGYASWRRPVTHKDGEGVQEGEGGFASGEPG